MIKLLGMLVAAWVFSGCVCGAKEYPSDFGAPCARPSNLDTEFVNVSAAECAEHVCVGEDVRDGGSAHTTYCSGPCTGDADCGPTDFVTDAGTCRSPHNSTTSKYCWYE